jgi:hypothetical protein
LVLFLARNMANRKAVEWISTVLYTLISISLIAALFAILNPTIANMRDENTITQTIDSLNLLDSTIMDTNAGSRLSYVLTLKQGELVIDGYSNKIYWNFLSHVPHYQPNKTIEVGKIKTLTVASGKMWNVTLTLDYNVSMLNITVNGNDALKTLTPSSPPYSIWIENKGIKNYMQQIDFSVS